MRKVISIAITIILMVTTVFGATITGNAKEISTNNESNQMGKTYYVDADKGNDESDGESEQTAWKTISHVSSKVFEPGDEILLKRGSIWSNQTLLANGSGKEQAPIRVGAYGEGEKPLIISPLAEPAFKLVDESFWIIEDIHCQGTAIAPEQFGDMNNSQAAPIFWFDYITQPVKNITVRNCDITGVPDAIGQMAMEWGGYKTNGVNGVDNKVLNNYFENILIEGCYISETSFGIAVRGNNYDTVAGYGRNKNIVVRDCYVTRLNDSGIFLFNTDGGLIENCRYSDGLRTYWGTVGIWHANVTDITIQYCETSDCKDATVDGDAHDNDWGSRNCINQYNYAHDNIGGFILSMSWGLGGDGSTSGNIVRYNVSKNNADDEIHIANSKAGSVPNWYFNNTFIGGEGKQSMIFRQNYGGMGEEIIFNNIFVVNDPDTLLINDNAKLNQSFNNCWYFPNGLNEGRIYYGEKIYNNIHELQMEAIVEENSIVADPMLLSIEGLGRSGAKLRKGSPCIDSGIDIGIDMGNRDYWGNSNSSDGVYDIGAYGGSGEEAVLMDTNIPIPDYKASTSVYTGDEMFFAEYVADDDEETTWRPFENDPKPWISAEFLEKETLFDKITIAEKGDCITSYKVQCFLNGKWLEIDQGTAMGEDGISIEGDFEGNAVRLVIESFEGGIPEISTFKIYNEKGIQRPRPIPRGDKIIEWNFNKQGTGVDGCEIVDECGLATGILHTDKKEAGELWVQGRKEGEQALRVDKGTYITLPTKDIESNWTLSGWIKRYDVQEGETSTFFYTTPDSSKGAAFQLMLEAWEPKTPHFSRKVALGYLKLYDNNLDYRIPKEVWSYITFSFDGVHLKVYENGVLQSQIAPEEGKATLPLGSISVPSDDQLLKGTNCLKADLDQIKVFKRALNDQEVMDLFNEKEPEVINNLKFKSQNGLVQIYFEGQLQDRPQLDQFDVKMSINNEELIAVQLTEFEYDESLNKVMMQYQSIPRIDKNQRVRVYVIYEGKSYELMAYDIPKEPSRATRIKELNYENEYLEIYLDSVPAIIPKIEDFEISVRVNGRLAQLGKASYDESRNIFKVKVNREVLEITYKQKVEANVTYRGQTESKSWIIPIEYNLTNQEGFAFKASSYWSEGINCIPDKAFDGNLTANDGDPTSIWATAGQYDEDEWMSMCFPDKRNINCVRVYEITDYGLGERIGKWEVQISEDGKIWNKIAQGVGGKEANNIQFERVNTQHIRFYMQTYRSAWIAEIEVYNQLDENEIFDTYFYIDEQVKIVTTIIGEPIKMPEEPIKEGYTFIGWYTQPVGGELVTDFTKNQEVYAQWEQKEIGINLSGIDKVKIGEIFTVEVNLNAPSNKVYAQDITLQYDPDIFRIEHIEAVGKSEIAGIKRIDDQGKVNILIGSIGGMEEKVELFITKFKVKELEQSLSTSISASGEIGVVEDSKGTSIEVERFEHNIYIESVEEGEIDKYVLEETIKRAKQLYDEAIEGNEVGQYPVEARRKLLLAIEIAQDIRDKAIIQSEVDKATIRLNQEIKEFIDSQIKDAVGNEDINQDGKIDVADLAIIAYYHMAKEGDDNWEQAKITDLTKDGRIDIEDIVIVANKILGY